MSFETILSQYDFSVVVGQKSSGFIQVNGTPIQMPITVISGSKPGPQILLTAGVHGGEYPCIETAIRLSKELMADKINGTLLLIHPVNVPAFLAKMQYYGPYDGKNLNRVFPGRATGTVSEKLAYVIHQFQRASDFYIDLHGGDIHESLVPFVIFPKVGGKELSEEARNAAAYFGFPYVVGSVSENGSIGGAAKANIPGVLAELGQCGRWNEAEVDQYVEGTKNILRYLKTLSGEPVEHQPVQLDHMKVMFAQHVGCWYAAKELNDTVKQGEKLGEIRDFFGNTLSEYQAERGGKILYLVTSLAITTGDPLLAIGVE